MFIFTILLDSFFYRFFTHIRLKIQMMPPPLSFLFFLFFSSFSNCYCTKIFLDLRDEGWVDFSFSSALITAKRFLLSFSSALTFLRTLRWNFREERLAQKDTSKIEFGSCKIWNLNPPHFLPLEKFSPVSGIEPRSALPIMSLMQFLQSSIDADMKIR